MIARRAIGYRRSVRSLILAAIATASSVVHAAGPTGLIVAGSPAIQASLAGQIESWLGNRGHKIERHPLDADGVRTLANCLEVQDLSCARKVIEARSRTDDVVYTAGEVTRGEHTVVITVYWIHKGHEAVSERRACEDCNPDTMRGTVDGILTNLSRSAPTDQGRIKLESQPSGLTVVLDNTVIGVTPLERDIAGGRHHIVLVQGTHQVGERALTVHAGETAELLVHARPGDLPPRSRMTAEIALGAGATAMIVGGILFAHTDDGSQPTYRDTRPFGAVLFVGGAVAAGVGVYLWLHAGRPTDSAPVVAVSPQGGVVGWTRAF